MLTVYTDPAFERSDSERIELLTECLGISERIFEAACVNISVEQRFKKYIGSILTMFTDGIHVVYTDAKKNIIINELNRELVYCSFIYSKFNSVKIELISIEITPIFICEKCKCKVDAKFKFSDHIVNITNIEMSADDCKNSLEFTVLTAVNKVLNKYGL